MNVDSIIDYIKCFIIFLTNPFVIIILTTISMVSLLLSLFLIPYIIIRIPEDYFIYERRSYKKNFNFFLIRIFKNFFGFTLFLLGFIMLFTPGQGLLTLFVGFIMINFPGKYKFEKRLIKNKKIYNFINKIRKRYNKPPLKLA